MKSIKKSVLSGYRAYTVASAYLAAYVIKGKKKRRRANRTNNSKSPAKAASLGERRPHFTAFHDQSVGLRASPTEYGIDAPQSEARNVQIEATKAHTEAAQRQSEVTDDSYKPEVVEEQDEPHILNERLWRNDKIAKSESSRGTFNDSEDESEDDSEGDSDDTEDDTTDDWDNYSTDGDSENNNRTQFQTFRGASKTGDEIHHHINPDECGIGLEEAEKGVDDKQVEVKGHLPYMYPYGSEWLGYNCGYYTSNVRYHQTCLATTYRKAKHLSSGSHTPDVPPKTQLEPITILDPVDFTDPPDGQTVLGRGTSGEVTLKFQASAGRWVAYKSILKGTQDAAILEGQMMQLVSNHPSFPTFYGIVIQNNHHTLVSEFLGDELTACPLTLTDALHGERHLELSQDEWCGIALHIIEGVWYMHWCDLLHHDIKTDNILLSENGAHWNARIIDFGQCRQSADRLVVPLNGGSNQNTPLEKMMAARVHWTTFSDVHNVGEVLRLIGHHGNVPWLEQRGTDLKKSVEDSSEDDEHPKLEVLRCQLQERNIAPKTLWKKTNE